jgi:hypothetical protein
MSALLRQLLGRALESAAYDSRSQAWTFVFSGPVALTVSAPWRAVVGETITLGWEDQGQVFGLPAPVVARERLGPLLGGKVEGARVEARGDLSIHFAPQGELQVFNASCGYEGWQLDGPGGEWVVAQGGGRVVSGGPDGAQLTLA